MRKYPHSTQEITSGGSQGRAPMLANASRRGGRAVEGTSLENWQACKRLVGSNPTPSAITISHLPFGGSGWSCDGIGHPALSPQTKNLAGLIDRSDLFSERLNNPHGVIDQFSISRCELAAGNIEIVLHTNAAMAAEQCR